MEHALLQGTLEGPGMDGAAPAASNVAAAAQGESRGPSANSSEPVPTKAEAGNLVSTVVGGAFHEENGNWDACVASGGLDYG